MQKTLQQALVLIFSTAFLAVAAQAQTLTPADRDKAIQYLESTKQGVLDATKGLSAAQWNFKAAPDKWSVAEVTEHIAAAEDFIRGMIVEKVMVAPARPAGEDVTAIDMMVMQNIPDRSHKAQAPEPLKPSNRFGSPDGSLKHFVEARATTEDFLTKTPNLRDHAVDSPLEVKADPNFPKQ